MCVCICVCIPYIKSVNLLQVIGIFDHHVLGMQLLVYVIVYIDLQKRHYTFNVMFRRTHVNLPPSLNTHTHT